MAKLKKYELSTGQIRLAFFCPGCKYQHCFQISGDGPNWEFNGDMEKPTFSPSLLVIRSDKCHLYVRDGIIQFLSDCAHDLRGQNVPLPDLKD